MNTESRRPMVKTRVRQSLFSLILTGACQLSLQAQTGPMVGTVKTDEAWFLFRPGSAEKNLRLSVMNEAGQVVAANESTSDAENDHVAKFHVDGLSAATAYSYRIDDISDGSAVPIVGPQDGLRFKTRLAPGAKGVLTAGFASCANASSEPVWQRMGMLGLDQLFLMGDTPYVDTADLAIIRAKHRGFLETPFLSALVRSTPTAGIWDDHDFGLNNGNGLNFASGKANTRRGFVEYRAHDQFGDGTGGVYHKIDRGVMEVFLIDPRWFSQTTTSPVDPTQPTCFGSQQMQWIRDSLKASRAPFKILSFGAIWQDKKNGETDDMFTYWYERDALLDFIRDEKIPGVILLGGDIHVSRHLIHPQRTGYDLHDFIVSPAHTSVIPSLDVPHPDLEWSSQEARQFMTLTADTRVNPPVLTARFLLHDGTVQREVVIPYDKLTPQEGADLGRGLRGWWPFDSDFKNQAVLGTRIDVAAKNGAAVVTDGGLRGGAAEFSRAAQQYLQMSRSALDDNGAAYTASLWCKPASLPAHGSSERHFLIESTLNGDIGTGAGYAMSLGFRAGTDADKVNLELHTHTLQPASGPTTSPTPLAQGSFACQLDRAPFTNRWAHVAMTFDSTRLRLYVDGVEVANHALPVPGPISETGGLIIGGHREGTGRNYDGRLDEVAIWTRALSPEEITSLYGAGVPTALPTEISTADTDEDTLEDWWEVLVGLDPDDAADALADDDNDAVPAWLERMAGTHPSVDDSVMFDYLRALASSGSAAGPLIFRHPSQDYLRFKLTGITSTDLLEWSSLLPGPGFTAKSGPDRFLFEISPPPPAPAFFRFDGSP